MVASGGEAAATAREAHQLPVYLIATTSGREKGRLK